MIAARDRGGAAWVLRALTLGLVALHLGLLAAALPDYRVSIDSAYHTALGRQYALHGTYFWDAIHYAPGGRPNLQGPLVHVLIGLLGRLLGGTGDDFVRANAMLGVVCWALATATVWFFARRHGGDRAALLGVAAFTGSTYAAGSYYVNLPSGWMFVLTPWAIHFFLERRLVVAALVASLACYAHLGGFLTAPIGLIAAALLAARLRDLVVTGAGVVLLTSPYWVHFARSLAYYVGQKGDTAWMLDPLVDLFWVAGVAWALFAPRRHAFLLAWVLAPIVWLVQDPTRFILQSSLAGAVLGGVAITEAIGRLRRPLLRLAATAVLVAAATLFPLGIPGLAAEITWLMKPYPRILDWSEMRADAEAIRAAGLEDRLVWGYAAYVPSAVAIWAGTRGEKGHWVEVQPPVDAAESMSVAEKVFVIGAPPNDGTLRAWQESGLVRLHGGGQWSSVVTFDRRPAPDEAEAVARVTLAENADWIAAHCERNATGDFVGIFTDPNEIPRRTRERGYCRTRASRMAAALLLYAYANEPSDPANARLAARAARGLGWIASLLADEATLDFRTPASHETLRSDLRALAAAARSGREMNDPMVTLLDHVATGARGGLSGRSAREGEVERMRREAADRASAVGGAGDARSDTARPASAP